MKRSLAALLYILAAAPLLAQTPTDYYQLPAKQASQAKPGFERFLSRYGDAYLDDRWYLSVESFFRIDKSRLAETFNGVINTEPTTKAGWSLLLGYINRERWGVEAGYAHSSIHNTLLIGNSAYPLTFRFGNNKHAVVARGKYRLRIGNRPTSRSGLWLGAGLWLVPNTGRQISYFALDGYRYHGRQIQQDTILLLSRTVINQHVTGIVEASAEYAIRLGSRIDMTFFGRKNWGLGNSLTTNLTYVVNGREPQYTTLQADGRGWSFGVSLRYVYGTRYDLRKMPNIYNLQGNPSMLSPSKRTNKIR